MYGTEIDEYIIKRQKFWIKTVIESVLSLLTFGIASFLFFLNDALINQEPPIFEPTEPVDPVYIIQANYLPVLVFPILGSLLVFFGSYYGYKAQISKPIADLFQMYNIKAVKKLTGRIELANQNYLEITWSDQKKRFILKRNSEPIAYAKSSNLFWKIIPIWKISIR